MSRSIDERIVDMQFNNRDFERGISESLNSIENLKKGLKMEGVTQGFEDISKAAKDVDVSPVTAGLEAIKVSFSALQVIGMTVLSELTKSAMDMAQTVFSSTVGIITSGGKQRALDIEQAKFMFKGLGMDIEASMNSAREAVLGTAYGLDEAAKVASQLGASGMKAGEDMTTTLRAVAGVAAMTSSSYSDIGDIFTTIAGQGKVMTYQLRQLSFRGMNAAAILAKSMGTTEAAVREMVTDGQISFEMFSKAMSDAFGEHATKANETYTGSLANMRAALKRIGADVWTPALLNFRDVFNSLTPVLNDVHKALEPVITAITDLVANLSGKAIDKLQNLDLTYLSPILASVIQSIKNVVSGISSILKPIKDAFRNIFPPKTGEQILNVVEAIKNLTEKFKMGDETSEKLRRTFSGLFAVLDLLKRAASFVLSVVGKLFGLFGGPAARSILEVTANIGDFLVALRNAIVEGKFFEKAYSSIVAVFSFVAIAIKKVIGAIQAAIQGFTGIDTTSLTTFVRGVQEKLQPITQWLLNVFQNIVNAIKTAIHWIKTAIFGFEDIDLSPVDKFAGDVEEKVKPFEALANAFAKIGEIFKKVGNWIAEAFRKVAAVVGPALKAVWDKIGPMIKNLQFKDLLDLLKGGAFVALTVAVKKFIDQLKSITSAGSSFLESVTGVLDGVRDSLKAYQSQLKAKALLTIAIAIGILTAALVALSMIPKEELQNALAGITVLFIELTAAMLVMGKSFGTIKMTKIATTLVGLAAAILILSFALKRFSSLDLENIASSTFLIGVLLGEIVIAANLLGKSSGKLVGTAISLNLIASSMILFSKAIGELAKLSWGELTRGLVGFTVVLAEVVAVAYLLSGKHIINAGAGLILLSTSMLILFNAVKNFSSLQWGELVRGLTGMAGALLAVTSAMKLLPSNMVNKSLGLIAVSAALLIIYSAMKKFSGFSWEEIAKGLTAMSLALFAITASMNTLPSNMVNKGLGIIAVALALKMMVAPLQEMGSMSWQSIAKGLVSLGGSMIIIAGALKTMQGTMNGAQAFIVLAAGLRLFVPALQSLGSMSIGEIVTGLVALAAVFTVLGVAGKLLASVSKTISSIAKSVLMLGIGLGLAGIGIAAFAAGLILIGGSTAVAAAAIVALGTAVISLIPLFIETLVKGIGKGLEAVANLIKNTGPVIVDALLSLLKSALTSLLDEAPALFGLVFKLIVSLLDSLIVNIPAIADKVFTLVISIFNSIADRLPELIVAGAQLLGALLQGIFDAMASFSPDNLFETLSCITLLIGAFAALGAAKKLAKDALISAGLMAAVFAIITVLFVVIGALDINNVLETSLGISSILIAVSTACLILSKIPLQGAIAAAEALGIFVGGLTIILAALGALAQIPGLEWLIGEGARLLQTIGEAIGGFIGGIVGGFLGSMSDSFPKIAENLSLFMKALEPFIEGTKNIDNKTMDGVKTLAETILILTTASILDGLTSWLTGGTDIVAFGEQLSDLGPYLKRYAASVKGLDAGVVEASANAALALAQFANNLPKSGGILQSLTGEGSLTEFAEQLVTFGPSLMKYAASVKGLDADVVTNSANAAMALAELANNLPTRGGVWQALAGEVTTLTEFAIGLTVFGPALMNYAKSVTGLDPEVVTNSAIAAMALSELANGLPTKGGVWQALAGEITTLTDFADQLTVFGPSIMKYAKSVTGLDSNVVLNSTNAAEALSALANGLPNKGGVVSWFTGDNSISDFGKEVAEFGEYFSVYYEYIRGIRIFQLSGVVAGINAIVEMAKNVTSANIGGLKTFSQDLLKQGDLGIQSFLSAFENSNVKVQNSITTMITYVVTAIATGKSKTDEQMTILVSSLVQIITTKAPEAAKASQSFATAMGSGIIQQGPLVVAAGLAMVNNMLSSISRRRSEWTTLGKDLVEGFALGIKQNAWKAVQATINMATDSLNAAKAAIGAASPAKKFIELGKFSGQGFAIGIAKYSYLASREAVVAGENVIDSLGKVLSNISNLVVADLDLSPTIRPVIDLTDIESGAKSIDAFLSQAQTINVDGIRSQAALAIHPSQTKIEAPVNGETGTQQIFNFEQNNYSPKSLSRFDIYRQTRNQFAQFKGAVSNV